MPDRDLFANFERMRREMDELFGDLDRRMAPRVRGGFSPAVDVYYVGEPARAVVRADLAGVDPAGISLEIRGRELILSGTRPPESGEDVVDQRDRARLADREGRQRVRERDRVAQREDREPFGERLGRLGRSLALADGDHESSPSRPGSIGTECARLGGASGSSTISIPSS